MIKQYLYFTEKNIPSNKSGKIHSVLSKSLAIAAFAAITVLPSMPTLASTEPAHVAADLSAINVNDGFAELVKAVKPAVVNISVTGHVNQESPGLNRNSPGGSQQLEDFFRRFFGDRPSLQNQNHNDRQSGQKPFERKTTAVGSGFIIDPEGFVVTNYHVIENADEIEVVFDDGTRIPAALQGTDKKTDLALLKIESDKPFPYLEFGNSDQAEVGDWVVAIGNPFGLGGTTTSGIISARGRDIRSGPLDDFIQIDASINRGNSGGPLFNTKGQVIGVNSAIYSPNGGSVGIGFAIPSSLANNVIEQLHQNGVVQRGYLGVHIQALTAEIADSLGLSDDHGALVTEVMENSPAEAAGIEAGDVILKYNGKKVAKMRDLPKLVALTSTHEEVDIELWRNESTLTIQAAIGLNDSAELASGNVEEKDHAHLGLTLAEIDQHHSEKYSLDTQTVGVIIIDVDPQSSAAERGLREGDIIKRVDNSDVSEPDDVVQAIEKSKEKQKESVLLLVQRESQSRFIVIPTRA